ncbi:hypothetical protein ABZX85_37165 [Streptomyces sp. NPDC004539]|uniref:hypothetical protein n=1 Tax=Streptomyces sp. NPDC004539 TaxID=3154280 RepID=UPI0033B694C8
MSGVHEEVTGPSGPIRGSEQVTRTATGRVTGCRVRTARSLGRISGRHENDAESRLALHRRRMPPKPTAT